MRPRSRLPVASVVIATLAVACAAAPAPPAPPGIVAVPVASASGPSAALPSPDASALAAPFDGTELAVGEAIVVAGSPVYDDRHRPNNVVDTMQYSKAEAIVSARAEGTATITLEDPSGVRREQRFRVVAELCRDKPLNPAFVLDVDERATLDVGGKLTHVEPLRRDPWVASASAGGRAGEITVVGQVAGRSSVMVLREDRKVLLFDVFVGGACKANGYASIAPGVPPGLVGPKGDGTCVRTHEGKATAAPCPNLAKVDAMPNDVLGPIACDWAASCGLRGFEGCCVGCTSPFPMKMKRACAIRALRAKSCPDVMKLLNSAACQR